MEQQVFLFFFSYPENFQQDRVFVYSNISRIFLVEYGKRCGLINRRAYIQFRFATATEINQRALPVDVL